MRFNEVALPSSPLGHTWWRDVGFDWLVQDQPVLGSRSLLVSLLTHLQQFQLFSLVLRS